MKKNLRCLFTAIFLFVAACVLPLAGFTQVHSHADDPNVSWYVDSVLVDQSQARYINPRSIENMSVVKQGEGAIYIDLKSGVTMLTLDEIAGKYLSLMSENTSSRMYVIDNKVVLDPSKVTIDKSYIKEVKQTKLEDAPYLKDSLRTMTVVTIELSPAGDKKEFRIRGLTAN